MFVFFPFSFFFFFFFFFLPFHCLPFLLPTLFLPFPLACKLACIGQVPGAMLLDGLCFFVFSTPLELNAGVCINTLPARQSRS